MPESPIKSGDGVFLEEGALFIGKALAGEAVGVAFLIIDELAGGGVGFQNVLIGIDEETAGAGGGIADAVIGPGIDHPDDEADDVARGAELAIAPGGIEALEEVFVDIALHVLMAAGDVHGVDGFGGLDEEGRFIDFEFRAFHVAGEGGLFRRGRGGFGAPRVV